MTQFSSSLNWSTSLSSVTSYHKHNEFKHVMVSVDSHVFTMHIIVCCQLTKQEMHYESSNIWKERGRKGRMLEGRPILNLNPFENKLRWFVLSLKKKTCSVSSSGESNCVLLQRLQWVTTKHCSHEPVCVKQCSHEPVCVNQCSHEPLCVNQCLHEPLCVNQYTFGVLLNAVELFLMTSNKKKKK